MPSSRQGLLLAVLLLFGTAPAWSGDGLAFRAKTKASLWGVAVAQERVIAVGLAGQQVLVKDGTAVLRKPLAGKPLLLSVARGEAGFVAVGGEAFKSGAGPIYRSRDGGQTFTPIGAARAPLYEVAFATPLLGYAVGVEGAMVHSKDGGATWAPLETGSDANLWAVHFVSPDVGLIAGGDTPWQNDGRTSGEIRRTTDGGRSWHPVHRSDTRISDFAFLDETTGFAAGVGGALLGTTDGGASWSVVGQTPLKTIVNALAFRSPRCGLAVGAGGTAYATDDGGRTWPHRIAVTKGSFLEDLAPASDRDGSFWTVAGDGTIARIDLAAFCR